MQKVQKSSLSVRIKKRVFQFSLCKVNSSKSIVMVHVNAVQYFLLFLLLQFSTKVCSSIQESTVKFIIIMCIAGLCSEVLFSAVLCSEVVCSVVLCTAFLCSALLCGSVL